MFFPSSKNGFVRMGVATNPNTPVETLEVLASDPNEWVRRGVARNPNIPAETLKLLATDKNKNAL